MGISSIFLSALIAGGALALPAAEPISFDIRDEITLARRAEAINYNQDYVASGASVQYSPNTSAGYFSVSYNTQADFVVGLGWQPGNANPITYNGSFSASGVGILCVYGWTTNPLVEYYVMEVHEGYSAAGTKKGTVTSDGGTYDIWEHQQVNQPSIQGTSTFNQYISIRQSSRTSGTVTVQNHFDAWAQAGMNLGTMNYQVVAVESWSGSGSGQISLSKSSGGGTTTTTTTTSTGPTSTSTAPSSGGTGAAQWGQCGGIGWTGATTCVSPYTCKYLNAYYSQCQ